MTTPVSFETAKLLKEKGFGLKVRSMYCEEKLHIDTNSKGNYNDINWVRTWRNSPFDDTLSAPTIAEVVMWLYEKHGIWVNPVPRLSSWIFTIQEIKTSNNESLIDIDFYESNNYLKSKGIPTIMLSPTEAYEAAIDYCLNNVI